jgi:uncharacterized protein
LKAPALRFAWLLLLVAVWVRAETIPPAPDRFFNDFARAVPANTAQALNEKLAAFERSSSNQIVVAVFPRMDSPSSIEDYTVRIAEAWKVGQKGRNNGAVLFVFLAEHRLYIQVGYGLEGVLPDAMCARIIDGEIKPRFRAGDIGGGLTAGVDALISAAKGEYRGTGRTHYDQDRRIAGTNGQVGTVVVFFVLLLFCVPMLLFRRRSFRNTGRFSRSTWYGPGGGDWGSGGSSGGFFSGGGGGSSSGFSGGGGSFGGGGAGGSW